MGVYFYDSFRDDAYGKYSENLLNENERYCSVVHRKVVDGDWKKRNLGEVVVKISWEGLISVPKNTKDQLRKITKTKEENSLRWNFRRSQTIIFYIDYF